MEKKRAGRPPKEYEIKVRETALAAIVNKYGSVEAGFDALLSSGVPSLIIYAWQMAVGRPEEKKQLEITGDNVQNIQIIQLPDNQRDVIDITHIQDNINETELIDNEPTTTEYNDNTTATGLPGNSVE
jgi:hypothetical protein